MEEIRIDLTKTTEEEKAQAGEEMKKIFRLNHTMPHTPDYNQLISELFPEMGEGSWIMTPVSGVRLYNVRIGKNVYINSGALFMAAGGIIIGDDTQIAANVQLISNNHDLDHRMVITCKPVTIGRNVWIGAGATILPGVSIGDNSVVGAGSVVTKDVPSDTIVAGNPARFIRKI